MTEEFIGRIVNVAYDKHQIVMSDKDGILQMFTYPDALDLTAKKQKQGWFVKLTLDGKVIKNIAYTEKPSWAGGGKPRSEYQKKNEGYILFESVFKTRTDLFIETADLTGIDYDAACEKILAGIERDYTRIMGLVKAGDA